MEALKTEPEAAKDLRLSTRTLERGRVTGDGPKFIKIGRRVFYQQSDLDEYIAERRCQSTSEAKAKAKALAAARQRQRTSNRKSKLRHERQSLHSPARARSPYPERLGASHKAQLDGD